MIVNVDCFTITLPPPGHPYYTTSRHHATFSVLPKPPPHHTTTTLHPTTPPYQARAKAQGEKKKVNRRAGANEHKADAALERKVDVAPVRFVNF